MSPGGWRAEQAWQRVVEGKPCGQPVRRFPTFDAGTRVCAPVPGKELEVGGESLAAEFGAAAAAEAMAQAGLTAGAETVDVLLVATHAERRMPRAGQSPRVGPVVDIREAIRREVGARRASALYGACAGGVLAIGSAMKLIQAGQARVAVAGGADCLLREVDFFSFCSLYAMSTRDCPPEEASCPFDARRDGFVLAEGAAFVVLEDEAHARARGAQPLAVVEGFGNAQNAYHMVASPPDALGPEYAMRAALADARVDPAGVDYINAHGTSTRDNDWCETLAIRQAFGPRAERVPISSVKSVLGHSMGAAGAIETVLCVAALRDGVVPPTINLYQPDPRCDLDYVPNVAREQPLRRVLNNSFGFGGHSASLLLGARP